MKRLFLPVLSILALVVSATLLQAGPTKKKEWKQPTWKVPKQQFSMISTVNASTGAVSIKHVGGTIEQDRDLMTDTFTEIIIDGKKTTLAALKKGMHVTYVLGGDGKTAKRIENAVEPPPPPTPVPTATPSFPSDRKK